MFLRRPAALTLCLMVVICTGCGSDEPADEKGAVEDTMRTFLNALADGNGEAACAQLTGHAQQQAIDLTVKTLNVDVATCPDALDDYVKNTGKGVADKVCGARGDDECRSLAIKTTTRVLDRTKDVEFKVQVSGNAATVGPAAGPEGYEGRLEKAQGEWLISDFRGL